MSNDRTVPYAVTGIPIRTLRVDVLEGPNAGLSKLAGSEALTIGTADGNDLVLADPTVSRYHLELSRVPGGILVVDHGSTNGTSDGTARLERAVVPAGTTLKLGRTAIRVGEGEDVTVELHRGETLGEIRGRSPIMRRLMASIEKAAQTNTPVLVVGESGTGKELVARALHELGPRSRGPFITVDCGALAPTLVASELFGHERGAFTGADRQHLGAFERANGGTLFLDEIGELPASLQSTLLGVLERRRFHRLGGSKEISVDVRIVSATNRDLRAEVNAGSYRLDLYYRLAVVVLTVPPLRDRLEDVPILVEHFLRECGYSGPIESLVSEPAMATLCCHRWPGNVRELRNVIEVTVAMGETPVVSGDEKSVAGEMAGNDPFVGLLDLPYKEARSRLLQGFEQRYLSGLLKRCDNNVSKAARTAQMDRSHLIDLLSRHQLKP
ncbi:MAG: sigma 54-interacting transcriptional regulator [Pseudomonadota bacterium]